MSTTTRTPFGASRTAAGTTVSILHNKIVFSTSPASGRASKPTRIKATRRSAAFGGTVQPMRHTKYVARARQAALASATWPVSSLDVALDHHRTPDPLERDRRSSHVSRFSSSIDRATCGI